MNHKSAKLGYLLLSAASFGTVSAAGQPPAEIAFDPAIECWSHSEFPVLGAMVTPPEGVVRSRLYFRCSLYPDYWFVDLAEESGGYRGPAPQAEEACPQVHYYVEALGSDYSSVRSEERVVDVAGRDECRRRDPGAAWFPGDNPNIVLGSLGATGMAPGFKTLGIVGFMSSSGAVAATGGISTGAVAGIAAAGGAAAGLGILATGGNSTTTTTPVVGPAPSTTTAPATTTTPPAPSGIVACFTLDPPNGHIQVNESLKMDGRCSQGDNLSYHYQLGDGRTKDGQAFVTAIWPSPGTYTVTLTVSRPGLTARWGQPLAEDSTSKDILVTAAPEPPSGVTADFTARQIFDSDSSCEGEFDGSPSQGDIARYLWELDLDNEFGEGVVRLEGRVVTHDWGSKCFVEASAPDFRARLTVVGRAGGRDSITKTLSIFQRGDFGARRPSKALVESSVASEILEGQGVEGQVVLDGRGFGISGDAPSRIQFAARRGRVTIEAIATAAETPFLWRFDFSGAKGFVPGSLRTLSGQEVARDAYSVVLRFSGGGFERARFEYRLEP